MSTWKIVLATVLTAAAFLTAAGVVWAKLIKPLALFIVTSQRMIPLLQKFTEVFGDAPDALESLDRMAADFRGASSLKDVIDRLDAAVNSMAAGLQKATEISNTAAVGVEASRLLADQDRKTLHDLMLAVDRLTTKVDQFDEHWRIPNH